MTIETVNESLNRWLVDVTDIRGRLPRLLTRQYRLLADEPEGIDDDFSLNGLYGVHDHRN